MEFYIAQGISAVTCILAVITMQFKSMRNLLIGQLIVNLTSVLTYVLLGGLSGAGICFVAILQSIVMYILNVKNIKPPLWVTIIFMALFVGCSVVYYKSPIDILSGAAAMFFAISLVQTKASASRLWFVGNPILWLIYDIFTGAYVQCIIRIAVFTSTVISIFRNDLKLKNKAN